MNSVSDVLLKSRPSGSSTVCISWFTPTYPPAVWPQLSRCNGLRSAHLTLPSSGWLSFAPPQPCGFPRGLCPRASPPETPCLPACHPVASKQTSGRCFGTFCWQAFSTLPQSSSPPCSYSTLCLPPSPACSSLPGPHFSGDTEHLRCTGGGCHWPVTIQPRFADGVALLSPRNKEESLPRHIYRD